jgi:hypothetical protein
MLLAAYAHQQLGDRELALVQLRIALGRAASDEQRRLVEAQISALEQTPGPGAVTPR